MSDIRRAVRVVVSGRVQGVGFRHWTGEQAAQRELDGWVRNLPDGTVEALVAGDPVQVDAMLDAFWKGPSAARVIGVAVFEVDDPGAGTGFSQR